MAAFLKHLEQERRFGDTDQIESDILATEEANELAEIDEILGHMKLGWDKLRSEGVPIEKRPLDGDLPWSVQFRAQAEADPTGKDMQWWKANEQGFRSLE